MRKLAVLTLLLPAVATAAPAHQFFAMDTALVRSLGDDLVQRSDIELVAKLSYSGLAMTLLSERQYTHFRENVLPWMDAAGVKLTAVYTQAEVRRDGWSWDPRMKALLPLLKGRGCVVWLAITGKDFQPSDPAADPNAVALVRDVSGAAAQYGLTVSLYPHWRNLVERAADAVRIANAVGHPEVGVTLNLCHWLRVDGPASAERVIGLAAPRLDMVTINAADRDGKEWIQPLDMGDFDVRQFIAALDRGGYRGPVGLQGYDVARRFKLDPAENLRRSIAVWKSW